MNVSYFQLLCLILSVDECFILSVIMSDAFSDGERKSMSTERTFSELSRPEDLYEKCEELCQALAEDLQQEMMLVSHTVCQNCQKKFRIQEKSPHRKALNWLLWKRPYASFSCDRFFPPLQNND